MARQRRLAACTMVLLLASVGRAAAETNYGTRQPNPDKPFTVTAVATFDWPWAIAFLPDRRMLVTEKPGRLFLVTPQGAKMAVTGVPAVDWEGQLGLLDVALSPRFAEDRGVYLTYAEPGRGGPALALARARLDESGGAARLDGLSVIWRQSPRGSAGQPGGVIAFSPDGRFLFLSSGDGMARRSAQDMHDTRGKILRLNLDGSVPADNPWAGIGGVAASFWSVGHRNPYGLAFAPDGRLWSDEMGPYGGDELNLIRRGGNYGWPIVSNGDNYDGTPIPRHDTRPEFVPPVAYWTPVIAPAGLAFETHDVFPGLRGSAFIGGLVSQSLVRIAFDGPDGAREAERWDMGARIRDVAVAPDGALWLLEDSPEGRLLRLAPR